VKLLAPLGSGDSFRILVHAVESHVIEFRVSGKDGLYARGRVRFRAPGGAGP
jgi:hypothetical protein